MLLSCVFCRALYRLEAAQTATPAAFLPGGCSFRPMLRGIRRVVRTLVRHRRHVHRRVMNCGSRRRAADREVRLTAISRFDQ